MKLDVCKKPGFLKPDDIFIISIVAKSYYACDEYKLSLDKYCTHGYICSQLLENISICSYISALCECIWEIMVEYIHLIIINYAIYKCLYMYHIGVHVFTTYIAH